MIDRAGRADLKAFAAAVANRRIDNLAVFRIGNGIRRTGIHAAVAACTGNRVDQVLVQDTVRTIHYFFLVPLTITAGRKSRRS